MQCSSGPPCIIGNTALSIAFACSSLHRIIAPRGPAERLVRRERHDVGVRHRRRIRAAGDQPDEVRRVDHSSAPTSSAISRNASKSIVARIRGVPGQDDLRTVLRARSRDPVHVELLGLAVDLVAHEVEPHARHVHRRTVGQVAAVGEHHARAPCRRSPGSRNAPNTAMFAGHPRGAARWRVRRRTAPSRGRSRAARSRRRTRSRRSSGVPDTPRRTCCSSSIRPRRGPRGSRSSPTRSAGAFVRSRLSSPATASATSGSVTLQCLPVRCVLTHRSSLLLVRSPRSARSRGTCRPPANGVASQTRDDLLARRSGAMTRAPIARTFASLCSRDNRARYRSWQSAARMPCTLFAAICSPWPDPPRTIAAFGLAGRPPRARRPRRTRG